MYICIYIYIYIYLCIHLYVYNLFIYFFYFVNFYNNTIIQYYKTPRYIYVHNMYYIYIYIYKYIYIYTYTYIYVFYRLTTNHSMTLRYAVSHEPGRAVLLTPSVVDLNPAPFLT